MKSPDDVEVILQSLYDVMLKKHEDYGPMNIAGAPGGAMNGLLVRMYDKLARLNNLVDTVLDLANYAIIGLLVQRGQWEGIPNGSQSKASSSPQ